MKMGVSGHVLRAIMMLVSTEDSINGCYSKTAHDSTHFWCAGGQGMGDELAVVEIIGGRKMMSLGVG